MPHNRNSSARAAIHKFADRTIVNPKSWAAGVKWTCAPFIRLPADATPSMISLALIDCLKLSAAADRGEDSTKVRVDSQQFLRVSGVRTWTAFDPIATVFVEYHVERNLVEFHPFMRVGVGHESATARPMRAQGKLEATTITPALSRALKKSEEHFVPRQRKRLSRQRVNRMAGKPNR